ncbi:MAG: hypothetical protein LC799_01640 [Actinobacteria bacterium]|nr:hypothetical protein [Actinomycetota bacterium]
MKGLRSVAAGALAGLAAAMLVLATEQGSAAALQVDGGVLQVFVIDAADLPPLPVDVSPVVPPLPPVDGKAVTTPAPALQVPESQDTDLVVTPEPAPTPPPTVREPANEPAQMPTEEADSGCPVPADGGPCGTDDPAS